MDDVMGWKVTGRFGITEKVRADEFYPQISEIQKLFGRDCSKGSYQMNEGERNG
ncbi:MAG: hypothetical protein ACLU4J_27590 [Butyricimonas paravirosa]